MKVYLIHALKQCYNKNTIILILQPRFREVNPITQGVEGSGRASFHPSQFATSTRMLALFPERYLSGPLADFSHACILKSWHDFLPKKEIWNRELCDQLLLPASPKIGCAAQGLGNRVPPCLTQREMYPRSQESSAERPGFELPPGRQSLASVLGCLGFNILLESPELFFRFSRFESSSC